MHSSISAHWRFQFSGSVSLLRRLPALPGKERGRGRGVEGSQKGEVKQNSKLLVRRALKRGLKIKLKFQLKVEPSYDITSLEEVCVDKKNNINKDATAKKRRSRKQRPERHNNNNAKSHENVICHGALAINFR